MGKGWNKKVKEKSFFPVKFFGGAEMCQDNDVSWTRREYGEPH